MSFGPTADESSLPAKEGETRRGTGRRARASAHRMLDRAEATENAILDAAVMAMLNSGYHATSVRAIADRAGMSVANVYNYFPSKHDLLFEIMDQNARLLLDDLEALLHDTPSDPADRLAGAVRVFVRRHITHHNVAFVTSTELRALTGEARRLVIAKRRAIESLFRQIILDGVKVEEFRVEDVELATRMVLDMTRSLATWYRPEGRLSTEQLAAKYAQAALRLVGGRADRSM